MKKFSIITVCLNAPKVELTCESIVNQTFQDFEWIVIDGGSDKETLDIFEKYKYRMDYFVSEKDNGIYDAMNKGIARANGEWLNFMNAGDRFAENDALAKVDAAIKADRNVDILAGITKFDPFVREEIQYLIPPEKIDLPYLYAYTLPHHSVFIKKTCFALTELYDISFRFAADYKQWIVFCRYGFNFVTLNEIIAIDDSPGSLQFPLDMQRKELNRIRRECFTEDERKMGVNIQRRQFSDFADLMRNSLINS